ncbi:MAG: hypothetical protein NC204_04390 [Candidatus Amulumruptor caecigallinarius]|nr:hypothetical protein [Candidatus Amulumruptor caecigallinarius]
MKQTLRMPAKTIRLMSVGAIEIFADGSRREILEPMIVEFESESTPEALYSALKRSESIQTTNMSLKIFEAESERVLLTDSPLLIEHTISGIIRIAMRMG